MSEINWYNGLNVAITVSDNEGRILYMNNKSASTFSNSGGRELIGSNLRDCHKPGSWEKICDMLKNGSTNSYTIEKNGVKKMIFQAPWFREGTVAGLVELSFEIPFEMDHFVRS